MAEPSEVDDVHTFMRARADQARDGRCDDDDDDDDDTAAALAEAAAARQQRRAQEAGSRQAAAVLVERAEVAVARGALLEGVSRYTDAIELRPHDVDLLAVRGQLCARLDRAHAALHDGELIVRLTPDWYQGHALCGLALFCMKQYVPAARAYQAALAYAATLPAEAGLREALHDAHAKVGEQLRKAAIQGDADALAAQLNAGAAVALDVQDGSHGFTALTLAAAAGRAACVNALVRAKADVECRDKYGKTPLLWAAAGGHEAAATALLQGSAALRACDHSGCDALMAACLAGHTRLATIWLQRADLSRAAHDGATCLHAAARGGHAPLVRLLLL